jgi:zinc protease
MIRAALLLVVALVVAPQQQPDRSAPPTLPAAAPFKPPVVQKRALSNGLPVWIVESHKVPVVHVTLVVRAGAAADPPQKYGLASLTADMLDEGAGKRDALAIADAVDFLGADLSTASTFDASYVDLHVPIARLTDALAVMADVVRRPTFPEKELQRLREELLTSFIQAADDPESLIHLAFPRVVYGADHRYGTSTAGTPETAKAFTVADLRQFHARHYVPARSVLIVAGDVRAADAVRRLEAAFGTWKGVAPAPAAADPRQLTARQLYLIDKPGAEQSQIRIGWVGVPRSTPDFFPLRVLNTILGGAFTSRLNMNLREEHGYAYGASSAFEMRRGAGPFYAAAGVQTDKTSESLQEFFKELEEIRKPIPAEEIEKAKNFLTLQLPAGFETTRGIAASLANLFVFDLPADYYATYTARVRGVSAAGLQRAADRYIQPGTFAVVIVGDRKAIEPKIAALNLGPLKILPVEDVLK